MTLEDRLCFQLGRMLLENLALKHENESLKADLAARPAPTSQESK